MAHLYTGLTRQKPGTLEYELALAADHSVSTDGLTHRFTIRADAAFDDSTAITAQTFADSIRRNVALNGRASGLIRQYIAEATAEANTFTLTLVKPIPYLWQLLALPPFFPLHPTSFPSDALANNPVPLISNGVYRVERFEPNAALTLVAASAWAGSAPATRTIQITCFDFPADLRTALVRGEVDLAWRGLPFDDLDMALKSPDVRAERAPGLQTFYLLIDVAEKPLDNLSARQGLSYMMDRERAVKLGLLGTGTPLLTLVPAALAADAPTFPTYDFEEAERVLKAGDFTRYRRVEGVALQTSRSLYGELYLSAISTINGNLQRQLAFGFGYFDTEPETFLDQIERGQFRMIYVGWTPLVPHPHAYLQPLLASDGWLAKGAHYRNPQIDILLNQATLAAPADQAALYREMQALALADVVAIPLWQNQQSVAVRNGIGGVVIEPNFLLRYDQLSKR
jgi:peptide/nickel transport system substrate-binding protein